jgi:catenin alpha
VFLWNIHNCILKTLLNNYVCYIVCQQVKADVQNVSGELIVSGLDSATSLIQAAKNLMNAVVLTVKSCYVASTKYPRLSVTSKDGTESKQKVALVWKMKVRAI